MRRATLAKDTKISGVGVHTGLSSQVSLRPAKFGNGIRFLTEGCVIPATVQYARAVAGATVLAQEKVSVHTPEHLLAAVFGLGVTDIDIELRGSELPILDGSSLEWCKAIRSAGLCLGPELPDFIIGDLALVGARVKAHVVVARGSHRLHHALLNKILCEDALEQL